MVAHPDTVCSLLSLLLFARPFWFSYDASAGHPHQESMLILLQLLFDSFSVRMTDLGVTLLSCLEPGGRSISHSSGLWCWNAERPDWFKAYQQDTTQLQERLSLLLVYGPHTIPYIVFVCSHGGEK